MELKVVLLLLLVIALARTATAEDDHALPGCLKKCGDVSIPYPFGVGVSNINAGQNCSFDKDLKLTCTDSVLYTGNIKVLNITLLGQLEMSFFVSTLCKINYSNRQTANTPSLKTASFTISSTENKFITVGCDTFGYLNSYANQHKYSTGCLTRYDDDNLENLKNMQTNETKCAGIGCCQVDIPPGMNNITIQASYFPDFSASSSSNYCNCIASFVVKNGGYNFSINHLNYFAFKELPMIVDWTVRGACNVAMDKTNYACKSDNSFCEDTHSAGGNGYLCKCKPGYEGNPYLQHGCKDFPECDRGTHNCLKREYCNETSGSFVCLCPHGQNGNATKDGGGCHPKDEFTKIVIGAGVGLIAIFVGVSWLYLMHQKRRVLKLKEKFFQQNGGFILRQKLSTRGDSSQSATIFTAEQLNKATNNFDESLIIGKGGYGTVFKGILSNNQVVAIKKSKIVDAGQVEQFINEVIILSQINHRNVVKLLGCCLETEVPLLVYEFVKNGTLFDYLHKQGQVGNVSWKTRLRIATEAAGALSYLHSAASIPIIHRDVKTANILLDDNNTVKVSDFGASRLVPQDQTEIATIVRGTSGYLDPEYMQSGQLTEKSDVYSFGVVLVELLTGEEPFSFQREEEKRSLTFHFVCNLEEDNLFDVIQIGVEDEENKQEIMQVAILAARCLKLKGEERPSMKEVAMELEGIRLMDKHPWTNTSQTFEERQYLLSETQSIHEHGDSSGHQNNGHDSVRELPLIVFGNGR